MEGVLDSAARLATQPNGLLVASLAVNLVLAWAVLHLWRQNKSLHDRIWEVLKLVTPLAVRKPA